MFKPGDKVRFVACHDTDARDMLTVGKIYTVDIPCDMVGHGEEWLCIVEDDKHKHNGFGTKYYIFELVEARQPATNDIDWLDRIQLNFRQ
jgi:hypothetical protein